MTGYGSSTATVGAESIAVEVKSVNHRFCEVKVRLPRELAADEIPLAKLVKSRVVRGAVDLTVRRGAQDGGVTTPIADVALAKALHAAYSEVARALDVRGDKATEVPLALILARPEIVRIGEVPLDGAAAHGAVVLAAERALSGLVVMRDIEGRALADDIRTRLDTVAVLAAELAALAPRAVADYRARLSERLTSVAAPVDAPRLAQEVVLFADRSDIAEELARLQSHLTQFRDLLKGEEASGRKMDFLVQEMNREVNTVGSKSQMAEISERVVGLKVELERIREQVQNVE